MTDFTPLPAIQMSGVGSDVPAAPIGEPPTPKARIPLGKRAKAAVIVRLLLNEGADIPLEDLPDDLQAALTQQMGEMGLIDRDTLQATVVEFADELDGLGLTFPKGIAGALTALDGRISEQTAKRLRKEAGYGRQVIPGIGCALRILIVCSDWLKANVSKWPRFCCRNSTPVWRLNCWANCLAPLRAGLHMPCLKQRTSVPTR